MVKKLLTILFIFLITNTVFAGNLIALYDPGQEDGIVNPYLDRNVSCLSVNIEDITFPLYKSQDKYLSHGDLVLRTLQKFNRDDTYLIIGCNNINDDFNLKKAMNYAYEKEAKIFLITFGVPLENDLLYKFNAQLWYTLFEYCKKCPNMLIVCSAGNDGKFLDEQINLQDKPSNLIIVGSCNVKGYISEFSDYGQVVDVYTLGENIKILLDTHNGTSFSAPVIVNYCSKILDNFPNDRPQDIKNKLLTFANNKKIFLNEEIIQICANDDKMYKN